jgi:GalNAc-alpha-(1->4)-GalNAc-alpha-(1->3)-diNAcBac-PP-undecaprenol alpha-1,4-N-acetyl-D-galactosaminyltransferase
MTRASRRVTLVISGLEPGGAERVMTTIGNEWAARGWGVTLITFWPPDKQPFYELSPAITVRHLGLRGDSSNAVAAVVNNVRRVARLRAAIVGSRPDAVISFMDQTNVVAILATRGLGVPVIVGVHADPRTPFVGPAWRLMRRLTYGLATAVVTPAKASLAYFSERIRRRGRVIPNPVVVPDGYMPRAEDGPPEAGVGAGEGAGVVLGMGRLSDEKGFDRLVHAFALVARDHPGWSLRLFGDGPRRPELERLVASFGLEDRVEFRGLTTQPLVEMARGTIFAMPSRYESFGNVLCEAMAAGLAIVAFDCPSGPREIVTDGVDGRLVPDGDVAAFARELGRLMDDPAERARLTAAGRETVRRYALPTVMAAWDDLVDRSIRRDRRAA